MGIGPDTTQHPTSLGKLVAQGSCSAQTELCILLGGPSAHLPNPQADVPAWAEDITHLTGCISRIV